jgi:hypothetical protein
MFADQLHMALQDRFSEPVVDRQGAAVVAVSVTAEISLARDKPDRDTADLNLLDVSGNPRAEYESRLHAFPKCAPRAVRVAMSPNLVAEPVTVTKQYAPVFEVIIGHIQTRVERHTIDCFSLRFFTFYLVGSERGIRRYSWRGRPT